jgi:hypothetical protein
VTDEDVRIQDSIEDDRATQSDNDADVRMHGSDGDEDIETPIQGEPSELTSSTLHAMFGLSPSDGEGSDDEIANDINPVLDDEMRLYFELVQFARDYGVPRDGIQRLRLILSARCQVSRFLS